MAGLPGVPQVAVADESSRATPEITSELDSDPRMPALFLDLYAPGLAAAGRAADARAVAPIRRDRRWLFLTGIRGLLAIALDDRDRAESAY